MIVVSMTSWIKRIDNVKPVVENIMKNTLQPDRLYLNLSIEEFPKKELSIPKELVEYFNYDERLIINWVDGENTKCMKKVFPILKYLNDDDIILCVDDDIMYPLDYIEKRVLEYKTHLQPITGVNDLSRYYPYRKHYMYFNIGYGCLFTKKMLNHWDEYVDEKILKSNNDDTCYAILQWLNGYTPQECKYYDVFDMYNTFSYNEIEPSGELKRYVGGYELVVLHKTRIKELTGADYKNSFNFFNKNNNIKKIRI